MRKEISVIENITFTSVRNRPDIFVRNSSQLIPSIGLFDVSFTCCFNLVGLVSVFSLCDANNILRSNRFIDFFRSYGPLKSVRCCLPKVEEVNRSDKRWILAVQLTKCIVHI